MKRIVHWAGFVPSDEDAAPLVLSAGQSIHARVLARQMVLNCLKSYPWPGRADLIPLFDPQDSYQLGQVITLPLVDPQGIRPDSWRSGVVKSVQAGENARQGKFQVIQVVVDGKEHWLAAALDGAQPPVFRFPPDDDELDFLAEDLTNAYLPQLTAVLDGLIASRRLPAVRQGEQVIFGQAAKITVDFAPWFAECPPDAPYLTMDELILRVWEAGELNDAPEELARARVEQALRERGYVDAGGGRWTAPAALAALDRQVSRRLDVPRNRSKIKAALGQAEELEAEEMLDLPEPARGLLRKLSVDDESEAGETAPAEAWTPPASPLKMPPLSFLNLMQGYFPLTSSLLRAFPPAEHAGLVEVVLAEGEPLTFVVNLQERTLKSVQPQAVYEKFVTELGIPAGTYLWLEFRGPNQYRIAPRALAAPQPVRCKQAWISEDGLLMVEETLIPMRYEGDEHLFRSEQRFEEMDALFREAEERDFSIFDAIYDVLPKLAALRPDGRAHVSDIFNAVFFEYRMCSYHTVAHELYDHPCFVEAGDGFYRFEPDRGFKRRKPTRQQRKKEFWQPQPAQDAPRVAPAAIEAEFWRQIATQISRKLKTLDQGKPFEISSVTHDAIELIVSTGEPRTVPRSDVEQAWNILAAQGKLTCEQVTPFANFNVAYVLAILAQLPGVEYRIKPLKLLMAVGVDERKVEKEQVDEIKREAVDREAVEPPLRVEKARGGQLIAPDLLPTEPLFISKVESPTSGDVGVPDGVQNLPILDEEPKAQPTPDEREQVSVESAPEPGLEADLARGQDTIPAAEKARPFSQRRTIRSPQGDDMRNKTLFSNHFLDTRLAGMPEWSEDPLPTLQRVRALWQKASQYGETWSEAQTEDEFIKPVLEALGWSFIVQAKAGRGGQVTRPDYALFGSAAARDDAYPHQGDDDAFYSRALAIAEAKYWGRPLSQKDASGRATWKAESNPSHQMVSYLNGTRAGWGILTNGRAWRLYSREVSSTASEFYEVDLGDLFDFLPEGVTPSAEQVDTFKRWWLFFRRAAFVRETQGKTFVQRAHEGSALYAREISDKLKELVFNEVMPEIAGGFVSFRREQLGIGEETPESLQEIYRASLSLLYKLLFLLYAEARSLLPMDNPDYRVNSLTAIAEWAAEQADAHRNLSRATYATPHYDRLLALFRRIDRGDPALGIPEYNGGLFSPKSADNRFLEQNKLSDFAVARAVDLLVRDQGQPVDYAFISVRNLGAIYEGLLENKLTLTPNPSPGGRGGPDSPPPSGDPHTGAGGPGVRVYLINDKGERKATGSYYTPDYIVEYIVRNTLDPILERRGADYAAAMAQVTRLRGQLLKVSDSATANRLRAELEEAERTAREAFLGIKVLDPAMGSGHFLVNAVDHLTDGIIERMQAWHDAHPESPWEWDPIQQLIEKVRGEIRAELQKNGLPLDSRLNDDTALLMRLVMKRCIYGVDLNEMAVELARVSLWLHTFTVGAPLSFLDHHLRWGNSLIGADVRTVEQAIRMQGGKGGGMQFNLFGSPFRDLLNITQVMLEIAERADATLSDVRESARLYDDFQQALIPYKQALDLWVSQYFGNLEAREFMELFGNDVLPAIRGEREIAARYRAALEKARALRQEKRFFHWDLEFPEVFVDLRGRDWAQNGGFDAVIGNPPYLRTELLSEEFKNYLSKDYESIFIGRPDVYVFFLYKSGLLVVPNNGYFSMVTPGKYVLRNNGKGLRKWLLENCHIVSLVDLAKCPSVFPDVTAYPMLSVFKRSKSDNDDVFVVVAKNDSPEDASSLPYRQTINTENISSILVKQANLSKSQI